MARTPHSQRQLWPPTAPPVGGPPSGRPTARSGGSAGLSVRCGLTPSMLGAAPASAVTAPSLGDRSACRSGRMRAPVTSCPMTDTEPGGRGSGTDGPPARPPGPSRPGTCPGEWIAAGAAARQRRRGPPPPRSVPPRPPASEPRPLRRSPPARSRRYPHRRLPPPPPEGDAPSSIRRGSPRRPSARAGCGSSSPSPASWSARSAP